MDQPEGTMDFKTLRAKFQDDDLFMKQPRIKPALPEKPKVVPPPQSPPHYLPAGARPSLLTSINQALDGRTVLAPRVVFKEDKKESKMPLIQSNSKGKEKSESKLKGGKDKAAKGSKEKLHEDSSPQKEKKENGKDKKLAQKESTAELVSATPPPKTTTQKKKGLFGFKKSTKQESVVIPADPILDTPSPDDPGPDPLIPLPSDSRNMPEAEPSEPKALLPNNMTLPDPGAVQEISPPSPIPEPPGFSPPPAIIPDIPVHVVPTLQSETPAEIEIPEMPVSRPASQNENIPIPPTASPTPPTSSAMSGAPPVLSAPAPSPSEPEVAAEADMEATIAAAVEKPPTPPMDPPTVLTPTKAEYPISALSALERAEDMSPGKRTTPGDLRILSALEKARKKNTSPLSNPTRAYSITPPPTEDIPPLQSPTHDLPELPPIDYEARTALPLKPAQVNSTDNREEAITGEQTDVPELLVVPPPPPRQAQPDLECMYATPQKPYRPPSVNLREFIPPPPLFEAASPAPTAFSEADATDGQEFDDVASDAYCSELPTSEWGSEEYRGPDTPDSQNLTEFYSNGITDLGIEIHSERAYENDYQEITIPQHSLPVSQDTPPAEEPQAEDPNSVHESTENAYKDVSQSPGKKKGKGDSGKKRKGTPKNPYAETHDTTQEKTKSGRFGKSEKKAAAEGPDEKELKKKEKQRLEKEKKEMKEKQEREKKEQKEREKKENEMKKKFKITGQEEAMYQATVTVTTKGRKNDLPVRKDDIVSIIRTTNCPKGKWLARDSSNNYGYVAVDHVELDIKEMLELGKKAARKSTGNVIEADIGSTGSRASNHFPQSAESFTDDSEEWTCDDDEPLSPALEAVDSMPPVGHARALSMPDMGNKDLPINHQHSHSDMSNDNSHSQARNEALQKLATFFHSAKPLEPAASPEPETSSTAAPTPVPEEDIFVAPEDSSRQETEFDPTAVILPPPDLYADIRLEC